MAAHGTMASHRKSPVVPRDRRRAQPPLPADPQTACANLKYFGTQAGAEALFRAFLAENDCDRPAARFWIEVYWMIVEGADKA
jgi:hypothetical protein